MRTSTLGNVALSLTLLLGAAACGDDDGSAHAGTTTTAAPTSGPTTETTTAPPSTGAPTTSDAEPSTDPSATVPATDPAEYAQLLVDAWVEGARGAAERLAVPEAVATLFSYETAEDGATASWALEHCEGAAGSTWCTFGAGGDPEIVVRVANEAAAAGRQQAVTEVRVGS